MYRRGVLIKDLYRTKQNKKIINRGNLPLKCTPWLLLCWPMLYALNEQKKKKNTTMRMQLSWNWCSIYYYFFNNVFQYTPDCYFKQMGIKHEFGFYHLLNWVHFKGSSGFYFFYFIYSYNVEIYKIIEFFTM